GAVARLHARTLALLDRPLDLRVVRLDRKRDHYLVDDRPHQDRFELLERPEQPLPDLRGTTVEVGVDEAEDLVRQRRIVEHSIVEAHREWTAPNDQNACHAARMDSFGDDAEPEAHVQRG